MTLLQKLSMDAASHQTNQSLPSYSDLQPRVSSVNGAPVRLDYENIETVLDPVTRTFWCYMRPQGKLIVTHSLLTDLSAMQASFRAERPSGRDTQDPSFSYFVFASRTPGIFSLGGDLSVHPNTF